MKETVRACLLILLDCALTGKTYYEAAHTAKNQRGRFPLDDVYYLSDGGYSRVGFNRETGKLFLTYNSRDEVREVWPRCEEIRKALEENCAEFVD